MAASSSSFASGNKRRATDDESSLSSSKRLKLSSPASAYGGSSRWTYDVFLSFRGDTRNNFTDHLYKALHQNGIITFKDDESLGRGTEISSELTKAIEGSRFSIVIFSKDYASSTWCLEELSKIVEFMERNNNHTVIPVFYHVDPSDVRKQRGEFKKAFDEHQKNPKIDSDKIQSWRAALERAANIVGDFISAGRPEAKLVEDIVKDICGRLHISSFDGDQIYVVGMDYHWEKMNALLEVESDDVRFIGICGMGGIGKTTIARYVYEKLSYQYDYEVSCFLGDVRHEFGSSGGRVGALQEQLLSMVMKQPKFRVPSFYDGNNLIRKSLGGKKVLLVLDDVDDLEQLNKLARHDWFGPKSRIIVTTRNEKVLKDHAIYKVDGLNDSDALQLFRMEAFKTKHPTDDYVNLSSDIVKYAHGLPLALKVLGSHLYDTTVRYWERTLDSLKDCPDPDGQLMKVLRISYDGLKQNQKDIFLHTACFFKGKKKDRVMEILDGCDLHSSGINGIDVLVYKSLITISDNRLHMHDLLQEMGWEIVREKHPDDRGKWSRLWLFKDVHHVLTDNMGTNKVKGIMLNKWTTKRIFRLNGKSFSSMSHLMLLKLRNVDVSEGQIQLPNNLRFLKWHGFPLKTLPSNFQAQNLFELNLCGSQINYLWKGMKDFPKLETIKLSNSHNLIETPDFTMVTNLKMLDLEGCTRLRKVHDSVGLLKQLTKLNLKGCSKLDQLPQNLGELEVLEELDAGETAIRQVPPSIARLSNLKYLSFCGCKVQGWRSLFWFLPRKYFNSMCLSLPSLSGLSSLKTLDLNDCGLSEESLPSDLGNLYSLEELRLSNNNFVSLPDTINQLSKLVVICLENCRSLQSLPELPPKIIFVGAEDCISLEDVSNALRGGTSPDFALHLLNCPKLHENLGQENNLAIMLLKQYLQQQVDLSSQFHIRLPGFDIPEWFSCKNDGNSVEIGLPPDWLNDDFMGIAMCGVFEPALENLDCIEGMECYMSIMRNRYEFPFDFPSFTAVESHHLWLAYISRVKFESDTTPQSLNMTLSTCIHAEFRIAYKERTGDGDNDNDDKKCKVIKCGIRLVYKEDKNYFQESSAAEGSVFHQKDSCPVNLSFYWHYLQMPNRLVEHCKIRDYGWH